MNQKLPYEQLIADKFRELHLPGKNDAWQKMKGLLDEEMPEINNDRKRGFGKWKNIGLLILLLTGATIITLLLNTKTNTATSPSVIKVDIAEKLNKDIPAPDEGNPQKQSNEGLNLSIQANENAKPHAEKEELILPVIPESNNIKTDNNKNQFAKKTSEQFKPVALAKNQPLFNQKNILREKSFAKTEDALSDNQDKILQHNQDKSGSVSNPSNEIIAQKSLSSNQNQQQQNSHQQNNDIEETIPAAHKLQLTGDDNSEDMKHYKEIAGTLATLENNALPDLQYDMAVTVPDNVWQLPDVAAKKKTILKEMKRQERKNERDLAKSYKTHWSFWGNQTDRWFAAGIAPYQNFAIASQQNYNYNSGAGRSMVADYIPSPYLQLHVTDRIYLLSEFQFNSPQATPNLLLAQSKTAIPMNSINYTENVYLKKLYYFNMPLSFYYSPIKNFYLGSGLQFSSFNSGLAYSEQIASNNSILRSQTFKIKDDSLSSKINASEWRYLFDANYYVDRFMFGFRYNQALNNFVNVRVSNILPPTQARNQAFQFYIRYNLVVSKRN